MAGVEIKAGLLQVAVTLSVWISLVAPEVMPDKFTVCSPAFLLMVKSPMAFSVGGWFPPALIVTVNVRVTMLLLVPPSLTVTVMVAVPVALVTGLKVNLPVVFALV